MNRHTRIPSTVRVFGLVARAMGVALLVGGGCSRTSDSSQSLTGPGNAIAIATSSLANGTVGTPYSVSLQATGGTGSYTWSVVSGSTPAGLTLSTAGVLSGTPTTVETSGFSVQATSGTATATLALSVTVVAASIPPVSITTTSLPGATVGAAYSQTLQATGGTGSYAWSVVSGSLPTGLTLSSAGVLSGTPTAAATSNFTVQAMSGTLSANQALSVTVTVSVPTLSVTTTNLPAGTVGTAYSQTLQATNGTGSYTWSVVSGSLPIGLTLSNAGVLSGTPTAAATSNFTVQVASGTATATQALSVTVGYPPVVIATTSLAGGTVGAAYSQTLNATGGTGNYTWNVVSGSLPTGLTLSSAGALSGTPTAPATSNFTVQVTSGSTTATQALTVTVVAAGSPVSITTSSLVSGIVGTAYSQTLQATGGTGTFTWSVVSGALPTGLTLSSAGVLSGTPTAPATSNFTVQATSGTLTTTQALSVTVYPLLVFPLEEFHEPTLGTLYTSLPLTATGGTGSYSFSVVSGSLPTGLTLSSAGVLSGTPTALGTFNFTIQVTSGTQTATQAFTNSVDIPTLAITTTSLTGGIVGTAYSQTLNASGGTGNYTWNVVSGSLPAGLTLSSAGALSGTPTAPATSNFTVQVTSGTLMRTQALSVIVVTAGSPVSITTISLIGGIVGIGYGQVDGTAYGGQTLQAEGGTGNYTWSVVSGSLPGGLTLSSAGVLSGTPTSAGTFNFTVQVTSGSATAAQALSVTILPALVITTTSLPAATVGTAYSQTLQATGGTGTYTWQFGFGSFPAGLTLSAAGVLSGTPTTAATNVFTVQVLSAGIVATQTFSVTVDPPLAITTTSLTGGIVGTAYSQTLNASGGTGNYTWSLASGSLPAGLTLSGGGVLSGTPTTAATSNFTVQAASGNATAAQALSVTVVTAGSPVSITTTNLTSGIVGTAYSATLQAAGGNGTFTWSVLSGSLPTGLTLSSAGVLSGTPTTAATSNFTVQVTSGSTTATQALSVTINPALAILTTSLPAGIVGTTYSQTLQAAGGNGTYTWSEVSFLSFTAAGLTLSSAGVISGTPTSAGTFSFIVQVLSAGIVATQTFSVTVYSPLVITTASLGSGAVGTAYSATLQAMGGIGTYTWSVVSGSLPTGLTLSSAGVLSGTPTIAATSNFSVQAASGTQTETQALSVTIAPGLLVITTTSVPNVFLGTAYSTNLQVTGGIGGDTGNYTWSLLSGTMPGLSVYGGGPNGDGIISGTAIATGTYDIVVQVTSGTQTATQALAVFVVAPNTPVVITTTSWPAQQVGVYSAQRITASGGFGTYAWSLVSGSLPAGLALFSDGVIGGTPTTAGTSNFTVQVTSGSSTATQALSIVVNP